MRTKLVLLEGGFIVLALGLGWLLNVSPFCRFRFDLGVAGWGIFATSPLMLMLFWCMNSRWRPFVRIVTELEDRILPLLKGCSLVDFLVISCLAGVAEETLFRGVIQPGLSTLLDTWGAVLLTGILFGLLHFITPAYAIITSLVGVYLGWLLVVSSNLLLPIEVHFLYDFLALVYVNRKKQVRIPFIISSISICICKEGLREIRRTKSLDFLVREMKYFGDIKL